MACLYTFGLNTPWNGMALSLCPSFISPSPSKQLVCKCSLQFSSIPSSDWPLRLACPSHSSVGHCSVYLFHPQLTTFSASHQLLLFPSTMSHKDNRVKFSGHHVFPTFSAYLCSIPTSLSGHPCFPTHSLFRLIGHRAKNSLNVTLLLLGIWIIHSWLPEGSYGSTVEWRSSHLLGFL